MIDALLIDDDSRHATLLTDYLAQFGIAVRWAADGEAGLAELDRADADLVLLDVMLPGRDGFQICREIRRLNDIPIIMLTARDDVIDRVSGLEIGADDYLTKPFEPRELVARIHSILRRLDTGEHSAPLLTFDGLEIDTVGRRVEVDGRIADLTSMEYQLLEFLARRPGDTVSRDEILNKLRGIDAAILTRSVDIMISRLRHKLGDPGKPPRFIKTVWGAGYAFIGQPRRGR
jgi:DNA-binding response OmpR family regulator